MRGTAASTVLILLALAAGVRGDDESDVRSLQGTKQQEQPAGDGAAVRPTPPPASPPAREVQEPPRDGNEDRVRPELRPRDPGGR